MTINMGLDVFKIGHREEEETIFFLLCKNVIFLTKDDVAINFSINIDNIKQ